MNTMIDLTGPRALAARYLTDTCVIERATRTRDSLGGTTATWTTLATVPCAIAPRNLQPSEQVLAGRLGSRTAWTVRLPAGQDVKPADRLSINGLPYEVVDALGPRTIEVLRTVVAVRIGG
jgi:SPP1 family predicted phage head-tail adaptor